MHTLIIFVYYELVKSNASSQRTNTHVTLILSTQKRFVFRRFLDAFTVQTVLEVATVAVVRYPLPYRMSVALPQGASAN